MKQQYVPIRQGDVYLEPMPEGFVIPADAKEVKSDGNRVVLAYGEVTGHAHAIYPDAGVLPAKLWDAVAERFLQVMQATTLQHEEHAAPPLHPIVYRVSKFGDSTQREYAPDEIRGVDD